MMKIPRSHPRYQSLIQRHLLVDGMRKGFVAEAGLIAHGRGEAFDYLIGERTVEEAEYAEIVSTGLLLLSERPVISVNGNTAALIPEGIVKLAELLNCKIEVNLFYRTEKRERLIMEILQGKGAEEVLGVGERDYKFIPHLDSERGRVDPDGIWISDTVLVPLEDGDRTEALINMGKKVIAIDLNPLSRTSRHATITIVDNVVRAIPNMIELARKMKGRKKSRMKKMISEFDNKENLEKITQRIRNAL